MLRQVQFLQVLCIALCGLVGTVSIVTGLKPDPNAWVKTADFAVLAEPNRSFFGSDDSKDLYLQLMKLSLTDLIYENDADVRRRVAAGNQTPSRGYTMIGLERLDNIERAVRDVVSNKVPGDFIEAGAWRGGATIFMRAALKALGDTERTVWVADSFEGLPKPDLINYPQDKNLDLSEDEELRIAEPLVKLHFERYGLFDNQVKFLKGWFKDTLPKAPIEKLAILRVDGDYYESTMDALRNLYDRVSPGGYVIVDDYGAIPACKQAVHDFRAERAVTAELKGIDWTGVYWVKE